MAESLASFNNAKIAQKHKNLPMLVENFAKYEIVNILGNGLRLLKNYQSSEILPNLITLAGKL